MTVEAFLLEDVNRRLTDRFERQVSRGSDRVAIGDATRTLSYRELNREANPHRARSARSPAEASGGGRAPAGQEATMVAAVLGALKAGKMYLPLDPTPGGSRT
jgi:non-ribosomal peptide synthetase component F